MTHPFGFGDFASMGVPGGNPLQGAGLAETMELVRKAWSSFALPPSMTPTVDPDEIARRVAELRAVEQWLVMNLTMLRGSIQALEIQQTTLATLRAFGVPGGGAAAPAGPWQGGQTAQPAEVAPTRASEASPQAAEVPGAKAAGSSAGTSSGSGTGEGTSSSTGADTLDPAMGALNPVAWWEALQKQFSEVASVALASMPTGATAAGAAGESANPSPKASRGSAGNRKGKGQASTNPATAGQTSAPRKRPGRAASPAPTASPASRAKRGKSST